MVSVITLKNGYVYFTFDLGSGPVIIPSKEPITANLSHTILVSCQRVIVAYFKDERIEFRSKFTLQNF